MAFFRKKIEMPKAITMFTNSVMSDSKTTWPDVIACISRNGFKIYNEDEGYGSWTTGLFALDTLRAYQVFDKNVANSIFNSVGYYFDYRIEGLKDWPPTLKEMYDFFCYMYFKNEEAYSKNPVPLNLPPITTSMTILLGIILGYKNITDTESIPYDSLEIKKMFNDFFSIVSKSTGRWENINKTYKVSWLL